MRLAWCILLLIPCLALAQIVGSVGSYRIKMTSQPRVVPVGAAKLLIEVSDAAGKPADGLTIRGIARMPGMAMGEREQTANPVPGKPGTYSMPASFSMGGAYEVTLTVDGQTGVLPVATGQDTGAPSGGFSWVSLLPWVIGAGLVLWLILRMRKMGQQVNAKGLLTKGTIGGILGLGLMLMIAVWAVNNLRRPGAMTPLEAQVMEMNTPPPAGSSAVELALVTRGTIRESVRYSGQAVGFVEQDVNPRVTGTIVSMKVYVGDRVSKGQVLAQLDTSQLDPELAEQAAMADMAAQSLGVAAVDYQTALQEVAGARADLSVKQSMVDEARAMEQASKEELKAAQNGVTAAVAEVSDAESSIRSAQKAFDSQSAELERSRQLFKDGFVSRSALQQAETAAANAETELHHAHSGLSRAKAALDSAKANVRRAEALALAASRKIRQAQADVRAAEAAIRAKLSAAESAKRAIGKERAGVAQARASYQGAAAQKGYADLRAEVDGVVTERLVSPGTVVNPGQTVLRVAQIAPIRLQANVPTSDLDRIRVGAWASVAVAKPGGAIRARVSSVSPAVDPQARTGRVELLVPNQDRKLLPGQFVSFEVELGLAADTLTVPVSAIRKGVGESGDFVWVAEPVEPKGTFTVRRSPVRTGASDGKNIEITEGVREGQRVVTQGGTYLKDGGQVSFIVDRADSKGPVVEVSASGFSPDTIQAVAGKPLTITFLRVSEEGCGTEVVFPELKIEKPLPLNKPVDVTFTPARAGELKFVCGMNMLHGKVVVR